MNISLVLTGILKRVQKSFTKGQNKFKQQTRLISGGVASGQVNGFDIINQHGVKNDIKSDIVGHTHPTETTVESTGIE